MSGSVVRADMLNVSEMPLIAFFHAQRTGGSEFKKFLRRAFGDQRVFMQQTIEDYTHWPNLAEGALDNFDVYAGHANYDGREVSGRNLLPVTIVRDPVLRCYSLYYYCKTKAGHALQELALGSSLMDFYTSASRIRPDYFKNTQCLRICGTPDADIAIRYLNERYFAFCTIDNIFDLAERVRGLMGADCDCPERLVADAERYAGRVPKEFYDLVSLESSEDVKLFSFVSKITSGGYRL